VNYFHDVDNLPSVVAVAHLAMEQAVTLRGKVSGRTSFRVALSLVPSRGARTGSASGPVELQLSIDMFRKVQCKAWGRIMQNVVGRGASAFFVKKMSSLITKIVEQVKSRGAC
jgi:DNA-binding transcriptional regulator YbjK